jgi:hypothetical protein
VRAAPPPGLNYVLPGWDAAVERRDAQDEFHSAAQARAWVDGGFGADHTALGPTDWAARPIGAGRAVEKGRGRRLRGRPWCV